MMVRRPEQEIQRAVVSFLRVALARGAVAWHTPNGGVRSPVEAAILNGLGVVAGMPDIFLLHAGRLHAIELKAPGGRLTERQAEMLSRLQGAGAKVAVVRSLDEAMLQLEAWGLTRGTRTA